MSEEAAGKSEATEGTATPHHTNTVDYNNAVIRKRPRVACLRQNFSRQLYQMIIRQLHHDGYLGAAAAVADATGVVVPRLETNSQRLSKLVAMGLAHEASNVTEMDNFLTYEVVERYLGASKLYVPLHLTESSTVGQMAYRMRERFTTSSLGGVVRRVNMSPDGSLVACGGTNGLCVVFSLRTIEDLMALEEVRQENQFRGLDGSGGGSGGGGGNVGLRNASNKITELAEARRFHEHTQSVEAMHFHPSRPLLLTGGREGDLYLRDYSQPNNKVLHKLHDTFPIRSAVFHPSGEYILYATDHTAPRLLNLRTWKLMTPTTATSKEDNASANIVATGGTGMPNRGGGFYRRGTDDSHTAALCDVDFSLDGRLFASCSLDGSLIVYDGVSSRPVAKVNNAHSSVPVTSVKFSRTGNFILSAGMDSVARLWDLRRSDGGCGTVEVMSFGEPGKCNHRSIHAAFSCNESHVLLQDTSLFAIHSYCVYSSDKSYSLVVPNHMQRGFAAAPFCNAVVSGGDDCRVRLWTPAWAAA
ncbi:cleavage stimulation factor subunit 1 [Trypanosoma rangeli]|uniref:Cleavage stimulation factor 50 kDa subunit n=1 Tax=Trypanosoma rangeli TaxID=5698 RepID=A0A422NAT5_TRYRA|nr:cleavage stimulation factor subunit 1 [Trypanosoma rangeli]RNF02594.1 cleavage stimulation factor subunit 1 [Trypanosoma rangeli]|eukprot:RNF02594.1 cleavage stimulation factor subunit 1 [Trypanosoma rangeli]